MKTKKREYYYHLTTTKSWGKEKILQPRDWGKNRSDSEPNTTRICVGPTVANCLLSIPYEVGETYYIYRTKCKVNVWYPQKVADVGLTKERWLRTPIKFIKVGKITINELFPEAECIYGYNFKETARQLILLEHFVYHFAVESGSEGIYQ